MSHCKHIEQLLSEYRDGALNDKMRREIAEHLSTCEACAHLDRDLQRTVRLLNDIPMPEPRLDLWQEFAPKLAEAEAQRRLAPLARARAWWQHAVAHLAEGMVLFTHAVAGTTLARMERYLIRDPFRLTDHGG